MKVYSQLIAAQLENTTTDYAGTITGAIWLHTTDLKVRFSNGTSAVALLANDGKAVFGTNGTAGNNVRFHRGAATLLQIVSGSDTTAEGTLSTSLGLISARLENYNNAGRPAVGNAGRVVWNTEAGKLQLDDGSTWQDIAAGASAAGSASGLEALQQKLGNEKYSIVTEDLSDSVGLSGKIQPLPQIITATLLREYTSGAANIEAVWAAVAIDGASENMDSTTGWSVTGAAATLTATTTAGEFLVGTAALKFDKGASATEAGIRKDTGAQTMQLNGNTDFWGYVYLPSTTQLADVFLRVYADSTANYRTWLITTQYDGSAFSAAAWNLINQDVSSGGTASGAGWTSAELSRYREVGVHTTVAGQTYTGIIFDSCYFSYNRPQDLGVIGSEFTLFNNSTQNAIRIDNANTRHAGKLSLVASVANTYVGGLSGTARGRIYRQVLSVDASDSIYFNTDATFSGSITTLQEIRMGRILRGSRSGTWKSFVDVYGTQAYPVVSVGGSTIDVTDPVNDSADLLNTNTMEIFKPLRLDGKTGYTLRAARALTANSSHSSGVTTLTLTTTSIEVGDIIIKRHLTDTLLSVVAETADEDYASVSVDASPNGIQLLDNGLGYLNPTYLYSHWFLGGLNTSDATRNRVSGAAGPSLTVNASPNFGATFQRDRYALLGDSAASGDYLSIADGTADILEANTGLVQVSLWFYFDGVNGSVTRAIIGKHNGAVSGWLLRIASTTSTLTFLVDSTSVTASLSVGWHHVHVVLNDSAVNYFVLDGVKSSTISATPSTNGVPFQVLANTSFGYGGIGLRAADCLVWTGGPVVTVSQAAARWNRGIFLPSDFGPVVRYMHTSSALTGSKIGVRARLERSTTAVRPIISKLGMIFNG